LFSIDQSKKNTYYSIINEKYHFLRTQVLPDNKDVFVSHATWDDYEAMLRILKRYTMPLTRTSAVNSNNQ
jgi:hypothetical protein